MAKRKSILEGTLCYLAGPIDFAEDLGVSFRRYVIAGSKERKLGIRFLDPTNKLVGLQADVGEEQDTIQAYKKRKSWNKLSTLMSKIVRTDLRQVDVSDFVIVMVDTSVHMCGSYHELILADLQKKPVLAVIKGGKQNSPSWLFGIIDHKLMFDDLDECLNYLEDVNKGAIETDDRWVIFRKELEDL